MKIANDLQQKALRWAQRMLWPMAMAMAMAMVAALGLSMANGRSKIYGFGMVGTHAGGMIGEIAPIGRRWSMRLGSMPSLNLPLKKYFHGGGFVNC
jgi:hypothetical protein